MNIITKLFKNKVILLCLVVLAVFLFINIAPAFAEEGGSLIKNEDSIKYLNEEKGCTSISKLKEQYQNECFTCKIVQVLLTAFMRGASKVYEVSRSAGNRLLLLGCMLWFPFWIIKKVSSFGQQEPMALINELFKFGGKVVIAYCFINAGISTLVNFTINPILGAGADFGNELLVESEDKNAITQSPIEYTGPTDVISKPVMDKILKLSERISNEVATNLIIGNGLTCFGVIHGLKLGLGDVLSITVPDPMIVLCGAAIWCVGFMLVLSVCYYLLDIPFRIGFAIIALPVVIGLWPFNMTKGKLTAVVMIPINAAGTFLFLALSAAFAMRLIGAAYSFDPGNLLDGTSGETGIETLYKAIEGDEILYISRTFSLTSVAFFILLFCYIYAFKFISQITEEMPKKFFGGSMTAAAGSPMHHVAAAATAWVADKVTAPIRKVAKDIVDIAAYQTGKAATTVAKAAGNVTIGAAGVAVGGAVKYSAKALNKGAQAWAGREQENVANARNFRDSLKGEGAMGTIAGNAFLAHNKIALGMANAANKLTSWVEKKGDDMMQPGINTAKRIQEATVVGSQRIAEAAMEVAAAANTETFMQTTMQEKEQKFAQAMEKFDGSSRKLAAYVPSFASAGIGKLGAVMESVPSPLVHALGIGLSKTSDFMASSKAEDGTIRSKIRPENIVAAFSGGVCVTPMLAAGLEKIQKFKESYDQQKQKSREELLQARMELRSQLSDYVQNAKATPKEAKHNFGTAAAVTLSQFRKFGSDFMGNLRGFKETGQYVKSEAKGIAGKTKNDVKNTFSYTAQGDFQTVGHTIGTVAARPVIDVLRTAKNLTGNTLNSGVAAASATIMGSLDVAKTLTSPVKTIARAGVYGAYSFGYALNNAVTPITNLAGITVNGLSVAQKYVKLKAQPINAFVDASLNLTGATVGFAAKAVDETLYAGYKATIRPTVVAGKTVVHGAEALARAIQTQTVVGVKATQALTIGSKSLKTAARSLGLVKGIVKAAANERNEKNSFTSEDDRRLWRQDKMRKKQEKQMQKALQKKIEEEKRKKDFLDEVDAMREQQEEQDRQSRAQTERQYAAEEQMRRENIEAAKRQERANAALQNTKQENKKASSELQKQNNNERKPVDAKTSKK